MSTVERVVAASNGACPNAGILLGDKARVIDCNATGNCNGIVVGADSLVTRCNGNGNTGSGIVSGGDGSIIESCSVSNNAIYGIAVTNDSRVSNCSADFNGARGITALDGCSITHTGATGNGVYGIYTEADANVSGCTARKQSIGIRVGNDAIITGSVANQNSFEGIQATTRCLITNNIASLNGTNNAPSAGIHVYGAGNRVDGNHVRNNLGAGIIGPTNDAGAAIVRNLSTVNLGPNYSGELSVRGPLQSPSTATSPWANFQ